MSLVNTFANIECKAVSSQHLQVFSTFPSSNHEKHIKWVLSEDYLVPLWKVFQPQISPLLIHHLNRCPDSPGCESGFLLFLVLFAFINLAQVCLFSILPEGSTGILFFFLSYSVSWLSHLEPVPRSDLSSPSLTSFTVISGSCVSSWLLPSPTTKSWLINYLLHILSWSKAHW